MAKRKLILTKSLPAASSDPRLARDVALAGVRSATFGSEIGKLYERGLISASEYSNARRWCEITALYAEAMQAPRAPRSTSMDFGSSGMAPDVDTPSGAVVARRHRDAVAAWSKGADALRRAGPQAEAAVGRVVEHDQRPASAAEVAYLRNGLVALSAVWRK